MNKNKITNSGVEKILCISLKKNYNGQIIVCFRIVLLQQRQETLSLPYQFLDFDWTYLDCHVHTYPGRCCPRTTNNVCETRCYALTRKLYRSRFNFSPHSKYK